MTDNKVWNLLRPTNTRDWGSLASSRHGNWKRWFTLTYLGLSATRANVHFFFFFFYGQQWTGNNLLFLVQQGPMSPCQWVYHTGPIVSANTMQWMAHTHQLSINFAVFLGSGIWGHRPLLPLDQPAGQLRPPGCLCPTNNNNNNNNNDNSCP